MAYKLILFYPTTDVALTEHSHISPIYLMVRFAESCPREVPGLTTKCPNSKRLHIEAPTPNLPNRKLPHLIVQLLSISQASKAVLGRSVVAVSVRCSLQKPLSKAQVPTRNNNARDVNLFLNTLRLYGGVNTVSYGRSQIREMMCERGGLMYINS